MILLLIGGVSIMNMRKATFPIVESTTLQVSVSYPGATPKEMEEGVATLIENAIRGIPGIKEFSSKSMENIAQVTIDANSNYDMDELLSDVKNAVDGISNFPADAEKPVVAKLRRKDLAVFLNLISENDDLHELNKEANRIEDDFNATGFISQITISGIPKNMELVVEIDDDQLRRYNLDLSTIKNAISSNNLDIHGGTIRSQREEIKIVCRQRTVQPKEIKKIIVGANQSGKLLTIGDIADVRLTFEETPNSSYVNGRQCASIQIQKLANEDLEQISEYVHEYINTYNATHENTSLTASHDFLENINSQLSTLLNSGLLGILLIILMLSLFLNFRLSIWVAWGIPASFLGMFICASLSGVTLNLISLFGMILIIGILVDDGVVIGENIFTHYEKGKSPRRAAIDGTMEVLPAVFTSVLTTMIAFTPLFFVEGQLKMMYEMAFVVIAILIFSLVEAIFVLPGHLASPKVLQPLKKKSIYGKIRNVTEKLILKLRDKLYLPFVNILVRNKAISLSVVTASIIITVGLFMSGKISFVFFPGQPIEMFNVDLALKPGANEELTKEKLFFIEQQIWEANNELAEEYGDTMSYIASTDVTMGNSFSGTENGTNSGMISVFLNPMKEASINDDILKQRIIEKTNNIPEAYKYAVGASNRFGAPVSYSLLGYDPDELENTKVAFESELGKISSLYNITNNSQLGGQEVRITLKPEAYIKGFTNSSVMQQVRNGFYGGLAQRMQEGKDEIWLYVRYPKNNRETIGQLEKMLISNQQGSYPLESIAKVTFDRSLNTINRYNGRREIRVDAYMRDQSENVTPILNEVEDVIIPKLKNSFPQVNFEIQGQQKDSAEQMGSMITYFSIAFLIIVLIIMIYFKSFIQGLLVLIMIPLGVVGAVWGHAIHGHPVSMMSLWGFIGLSGTIINDAIVFLSKYNQSLIKGQKVMDAVLEAGKQRFRPIFLTSVTTTAGLMPLILSNSPDAQLLIPMAIALAYGILFGTIFILIILPVVTLIANNLQIGVKRLMGNKDITPEMVEVAVINHQIEEKLNKAMGKDFEV
ncbi:MAG: efflux RND transporter permease subunit [Bacteroidetes bacterium]|nr:efflux RND transporter permease subunit [Bacteroidota bacterium]MBT7493008.1 efflux RND transporter permease subunit [Bacteroidota bacterium]